MKNRVKTLGIWLAVTVLIVSAFFAGADLRALQKPAVPSGTSVQANALLKLTPEWSPVSLRDADRSPSENRDLVYAVVNLLKEHYYEPITKEKETVMARGAVRGMLESLDDPDSRFLDPTEQKLLNDAGFGKFHGIGAVLALREVKVDELDATKLIIVSAMPGSPAQKAGLIPGDSVTHIGGKWIVTYDPFKEANLEKLAKAARNKEIDAFTYQKAYETAYKKLKEGVTIVDALETLTSKSSGEVGLRIERPGRRDPIELKLSCANTVVDPVTSRATKQGIAYIRISQFNTRAVREFAVELKRAQANGTKALVLDLRGNPGGLIDAAAEIAGRITGGGVMAIVESSNGRRTIRKPRRPGLGLPVAVLVDEGTASVAELMAGTLRENSAAILVGDKTFGDGLMQTPLMLQDGSAAILTTGKMLTAKGFDFNGKGLQPNKKVERDDRRADAQLEEAVNVLLAKLGKA